MSRPVARNTSSPFQGEGWDEGLLHPRNLKLIPEAKKLRRGQTNIEKEVWYHLRNRQLDGFKFRRQYPIGKFIADFVCVEVKCILELDGGQHSLHLKKDALRDQWLKQQGYTVIRIWNHEWIENRSGVLQHIWMILKELHSDKLNPHPNPLPERERG